MGKQGKIIPQDVEIEKAVLGAVLLSRNSAEKFEEFLKGDESANVFHDEKHRLIAASIFRIIKKGGTIDMLQVIADMRLAGTLEDAGGAYYLSQLTSGVSSAANLDYHMKVVTQMHFRREMIRIGGEMVEKGYTDTEDIFEAKNEAIEEIELMESVFIHGTAKPVYAEMADEVERIKIKAEKWRNGERRTVDVTTGFPTLDFLTNGYSPHTVWLTGALSSQGKTSFMLSSAIAGAKQGVPQVLMLFEITKKNARMRILSMLTGIHLRKVVSGTLTHEEQSLLAMALEYLDQMPLWMEECGGMESRGIVALWKKYIRKYGVKVFWGDYIQLVKQLGTIRGYDSNNTQTVAEMAQRTRTFAGSSKWECCIHWLSQFNQDAKKRKDMTPDPGDFAGSKVLYESATHVGGLYRPGFWEFTNPGYYESVHPNIDREVLDKSINYHLMKQSDGPVDLVPLEWVGRQTMVKTPTGHHHLEQWGAGIHDHAPETRTDYERMLIEAGIMSGYIDQDNETGELPKIKPREVIIPDHLDGKGFPF